MEKQNVQAYRLSIADPTPLGLFGLAMVTLVASSQKLGITDWHFLILPWAIFLGGIAQLIASIQDSKHHNIFGATALWRIRSFSRMGDWAGNGSFKPASLGEKQLARAARSKTTEGLAFIGYLIFSLFMTIGAMETHKVLFLIFVFIDFLFLVAFH